MLIIFDLDDTLIDTSGSITPFKMRLCLKKMVHAGLRTSGFEKDYERLLQINQTSKSSKSTWMSFLKHHGGEDFFLKLALEEMKTPLPEDFQVKTTPHAKEILEFLKEKHSLALVTGGSPLFQLQKLKKAGIHHFFSSNIAVSEDFRKKPLYEEAACREGMTSFQEVLVCGDRIEIDLEPAHELGCKTVHMRWGRGRDLETKEWITHSISGLVELRGCLQSL